jgi:hypothetical protein
MVHLWEISSTGQQRLYCSLQGSHGAINAIDFDNEGVMNNSIKNEIHFIACFFSSSYIRVVFWLDVQVIKHIFGHMENIECLRIYMLVIKVRYLLVNLSLEKN